MDADPPREKRPSRGCTGNAGSPAGHVALRCSHSPAAMLIIETGILLPPGLPTTHRPRRPRQRPPPQPGAWMY